MGGCAGLLSRPGGRHHLFPSGPGFVKRGVVHRPGMQAVFRAGLASAHVIYTSAQDGGGGASLQMEIAGWAWLRDRLMD